jgi:hypothetical protein
MCALVVVATVLTAVMLAATILPATAGGRSAIRSNDTARKRKGPEATATNCEAVTNF